MPMNFLLHTFKSWLRPLVAVLTAAGFGSSAALAEDWQTLKLPKAGEMRVRHGHTVTAANAAAAEAAAETLVKWTREKRWSPLRVIVDDDHPLVRALKAGPVLVLTPADAALPVIWLSLDADPKKRRALLEERGGGGVTIHDLPASAAAELDLRWLGL